TAANTAVMLSQLGVKVLLLDADLRQPRCHEVLGIDNDKGLTEVLTGQCLLQNAIHQSCVKNLYFITGGSTPPNATELLGSEKMHRVVTEARGMFEYVVIDSAPAIPVSDAVVLSTVVDGTILVIDGERTPRQVVRTACKRMRHFGVKLFGVVLNKFNAQHEGYYYYSSYYNDASNSHLSSTSA